MTAAERRAQIINVSKKLFSQKGFNGTTTKEIREREVIVMDTWTNEEKAWIPNDYVLALIGAAPPIKFLESVGITIPKS